MKYFKGFKKFLPLILIVPFIISCAVSPQTRIEEAEAVINDSKRVNARKYSPDKLNKAESYLKEAKSELKAENDKKAIEKADKAKDTGYDAYFSSLSEFVKHYNKRLVEARESAEKNSADEVVPDKYGRAEKKYEEIQKELAKVELLKSKLKEEIEKKEKKS